MAGRTDYSHDEWMELRRAMMGAAVLVSLAEGGGEDMIPEMLAVSEHLLSARRGHKSQLCRELADIQPPGRALLESRPARAEVAQG